MEVDRIINNARAAGVEVLPYMEEFLRMAELAVVDSNNSGLIKLLVQGTDVNLCFDWLETSELLPKGAEIDFFTAIHHVFQEVWYPDMREWLKKLETYMEQFDKPSIKEII